MQHHKLAEDLPSAHITKTKDRVKVYTDNTIYFNDGQEFEIHLVNPTVYNVLAKIYINETPLSTSGIVLGSKSNMYLDRYIDKPDKFKFNTSNMLSQINRYVRPLPALIWSVRVEFYKEKMVSTISSNPYTFFSNHNSSQSYIYSYGNFEDIPMNGTSYHIKPISTSDPLHMTTKLEENGNINGADIRHYCTECGYRIRKQSWKFCPKCGTKL